MIYNNAEFMGVPWETIIKMYRAHIGTQDQATCEDYLNDFLDFVRKHPACAPEQATENLLGIAADAYFQILRKVSAHFRDMFLQKQCLSNRTQNKIIKTAVEQQLMILATSGESNSMKGIDAKALGLEHRNGVENLIDLMFRKFELNKDNRAALPGSERMRFFLLSRLSKQTGLSGMF